jgi:hypothetical protein
MGYKVIVEFAALGDAAFVDDVVQGASDTERDTCVPHDLGE